MTQSSEASPTAPLAASPQLARTALLSTFFTLASFALIYILSFTFRYSIPVEVWPPQDHRFEINNQPSVYNVSNLWSNFDSNYYMKIVLLGYDRGPYNPNGGQSTWALLPLYPILVKSVGAIVGAHADAGYFAIGLALSNLFLLCSLFLLAFLLRALGFNADDWVTVCILLLSFPAAYFLHLFYAESLFLCLSTACLLLIFRRRYLLASLTIVFLGITRLFGLVLFLPLVASYFLKFRDEEAPQLAWKLPIFLVIGLIGTALFLQYSHSLSGNYFTPLRAQYFNRGGGDIYPLKSLVEYYQIAAANRRVLLIDWYLNIAFIVFALGSSAILLFSNQLAVAHKIPLFLYQVCYLLLPTSTADASGIFRFTSVLVPFFIALLLICKRSRLALLSVILVSALLQSFFLLLFVNKYAAPAYGF